MKKPSHLKKRVVNHDQLRPLLPGHFYRKNEGWLYFGLSPNIVDQKIQNGEIPPPVLLTDSGRAKGWFGETILKWQAERQAKAEAAAKVA